MKLIEDLLIEAFTRRYQRHYPELFIAVDIHGTIFKPTKHTFISDDGCESVKSSTNELIPYPFALEALKALSIIPFVRLILWTSSNNKELNKCREVLESAGVKISFVNENPICQNNDYCNFSSKFCFDILLDDKAGFDPENDWDAILEFVENSIGFL